MWSVEEPNVLMLPTEMVLYFREFIDTDGGLLEDEEEDDDPD